MKNLLIVFTCISMTLCSSCGEGTLGGIVGVADAVINGEGGPSPLTNDEVIKGLKEALAVGTNNSSSKLSAAGGFLKNDLIKIPFPPDAEKVRKMAMDIGMGSQVDKFVATLNGAAEEAAKESAPIFLDAITSMSIQDGFNILKGGENAATNYLKDKTQKSLMSAFSPKVGNAIEKVELTKYWSPIITKYNTATLLTGGEKINPDLNNYITGKAIDALFLMISKEENNIRKDPLARVSDILKRVFGSPEANGK